MELMTFEDTARSLVAELETTLSKLAIAADTGISTSHLESKAQKLAAKLKASAELFGNINLYKDIPKTDHVYSWDIGEELPDIILPRYASLAKRIKDTPEVYQHEGAYYAQVSNDLFLNLADLPEVAMPQFKVKLEGNTLMAVRADLYDKLPKATKEMLALGSKGEEAHE